MIMNNGNMTNFYGAVSAEYNLFSSFGKWFDSLTSERSD